MLKVWELQGSTCTLSTSWVFICKGIATATGLNKHLDQSQINYLVRRCLESKPVSRQGMAWTKANTLNLSVSGIVFFKEVKQKMLDTPDVLLSRQKKVQG